MGCYFIPPDEAMSRIKPEYRVFVWYHAVHAEMLRNRDTGEPEHFHLMPEFIKFALDCRDCIKRGDDGIMRMMRWPTDQHVTDWLARTPWSVIEPILFQRKEK